MKRVISNSQIQSRISQQYDFEEEQQQQQQFNKDQEKYLNFLNRLIEKNKINTKNCFELTTIQLNQLKQFLQIQYQSNWEKIAHHLLSRFKIYGIRVDSFHQLTFKMVNQINKQKEGHGLNEQKPNSKLKIQEKNQNKNQIINIARYIDYDLIKEQLQLEQVLIKIPLIKDNQHFLIDLEMSTQLELILDKINNDKGYLELDGFRNYESSNLDIDQLLKSSYNQINQVRIFSKINEFNQQSEQICIRYKCEAQSKDSEKNQKQFCINQIYHEFNNYVEQKQYSLSFGQFNEVTNCMDKDFNNTQITAIKEQSSNKINNSKFLFEFSNTKQNNIQSNSSVASEESKKCKFQYISPLYNLEYKKKKSKLCVRNNTTKQKKKIPNKPKQIYVNFNDPLQISFQQLRNQLKIQNITYNQCYPEKQYNQQKTCIPFQYLDCSAFTFKIKQQVAQQYNNQLLFDNLLQDINDIPHQNSKTQEKQGQFGYKTIKSLKGQIWQQIQKRNVKTSFKEVCSSDSLKKQNIAFRFISLLHLANQKQFYLHKTKDDIQINKFKKGLKV